MQLKNSFIFLFFLSALMSTALSAQNVNVKGRVQNQETKEPVQNVKVLIEGLDLISLTDDQGMFLFEKVSHGPKQLSFLIDENEVSTIEIDVKSQDLDLGVIDLTIRSDGQLKKNDDEIPIISLSDDDIDQDLENQNISGILSASRDVFVSAAAFTFGPARFRIRGYDSENTIVYMNGTPVNELNSGRVFWNAWGGLNDVTRNRTNDVGLSPTNYSFGGIGGASSIDTRASGQRKQLRVSYSISNRSYRNRLMATWGSGLLKNGWAVSLSGSRRWADEGFIEGTFYDAWAYFASVDKIINPKHTINLTAFGAPIKRGRSSGSFQELYDLTDNNYYNPVWGFQQGEKRNSRVANSHEPTAILRHDWKISDKANLTTAVSYQFGRNGSTALDWFDANDPRPDYYRKLPSFFEDENEELAAAVAESFKNPSISQLDWESFYDENRNSLLTEKFSSLLEGQTYSGRWSQYVIEDRRYDSKDLNFNSVYENNISDNFKLNFGLTYQNQEVHNFKVVEDLLGGDFYVNVDKFAVRDSVINQTAQINNVDDENLILGEGDIFGYNYKDHIRQYSSWIQAQFTFNKLDFFLAGNVVQTQFWREGLYRTGRFQENSLGESEKQNFTNFGVKGGLTYKITGRHYLYANGAYISRAPYIRNAYVSPRTRDQLLPNLTDEKILSGEAGYILRSPNIKGRASVYYTAFEDQIRIIRFFNDLERAFGNYVLSNQDRIHRGIELALEAKLFAGLSVSAVAAIGDYSNSSRPIGSIFQDNIDDLNRESNETIIYTDGYKVSGMPQQAFTFGINYSSPKYWFANLNFNYFDQIWINTNPVRRTADAVYNLDSDLDRFASIIDQEKVPAAFTMDFFGGKSFKFGDYFLYLNVGINNLLDKRDFITGGFEQLRFDRERNASTFPPRYFYSFGRNYFINIAFRY